MLSLWVSVQCNKSVLFPYCLYRHAATEYKAMNEPDLRYFSTIFYFSERLHIFVLDCTC